MLARTWYNQNSHTLKKKNSHTLLEIQICSMILELEKVFHYLQEVEHAYPMIQQAVYS